MSDDSPEISRSQTDPTEDRGETRRDPMAPPEIPCECFCLHCQRTFMSDQMWLQRVIGDPHGFGGKWMCPTPNCDGAGYAFDIFPTDPNNPDSWDYEGDEEDFYDEDADDEFEADDDDEFEFDDDYFDGLEDGIAEYDPAEPAYQELDERLGDGEDDLIEGDEWKLGLAAGEPIPPQMFWPEAQRREWEEEQKKYDGPDLRPREVDWSDREYPEQDFKEDDIPF